MFNNRYLKFALTFVALSAIAIEAVELNPVIQTSGAIESGAEIDLSTNTEIVVSNGNKKIELVGENALPGGGDEPSPAKEYMFSSSELYNLISENFGVLSDDLFGEHHDAYTGEVGFQQTDLAIQTNLGLPINVKRDWSANSSNTYRIFGDWSLDLPRIYGPILGNFHTGPELCSTNWEATRYIANTGEPQDSPNGPFLGGTGGSSLLLEHNNNIPAPAGTLFVTKDHWIVSCANGVYTAKSPQGLTYTFGQRAFKGTQGISASPTIGFNYVNLLVTQIKDRFGKTINFSYSNALIQSISSSDGATITFSYNSSNLVSSISANGRTWLYSYSGNELQTVTLPDSRFWSFDISDLRKKPSLTDTVIDSASGTIVHPYGAVGAFDARETLHGRSKVSTIAYESTGARLFKPNEAYLSLSKKSINESVWTYTYSQNVGGYIGTSVSDTKTITITDPENTVTEITYQRSFDWQEGQVVRKTISDSSGLLETITNAWSGGPAVGKFMGNTFSNTAKDDHRVNLTSQTVVRNSDTYTSSYSTFDVFGIPQLTSESNNFNGKKRYTKQFFYNDTSNWLIGLPSYTEVSSDGSGYTETNRTTYHGATSVYKSLPYEERAFGRWYKRNSSYHTTGMSAGLLNKVEYNGPNRWVEYSNYHRGIAQTIKTPQSLTALPQYGYKAVDDNGWVTKVTDFMGQCVNYDYDDVGRMILVDPCDTRWSNISISYSTVGGNEGLDYVTSGMLKQTVTRGNYQKVTYLDSLLRPAMTKEWDNANLSTSRYSRKQFDAFNRLTYESLPSSSSNTLFGITNQYDGLGRLTVIDDNTTSGSITYSYLPSNRVQVTDNKGNVTTSTYIAYGEPELNLASSLEAPHSFNTVIDYNIYGNIMSVVQGGVKESRVYDSYQQLCKLVRPDVGNTAFFKDALGQISWQARGGSVDGTTAACNSNYSTTDKATFAYDNLGNIKSISFSDNSPAKVYVYDANSRLTTLTSGGVVNSYEYNSDNGIEKETMSVDGQSFVLDYEYDSNGNLANTIYPSGANIAYSPNALGQPSKAGSYALIATYHPNGMVKSHNYGNGFTHTSTQNNSGIPYTFYDVKSGIYAINHGFSYDANKNLNVLDDKINNAYDLSLSYDGLDRLSVISASYLGAGAVNYDGLGNITYYKIGNKTISYYYNGSNQLSYTSGNKNYNFNYDYKGNVTSNGTRGFTYNAANQMVQSDGYLYTYDGHNKRVKEQGSNGISYSFYGSNGKLMFRRVNNLNVDYYYLGNKLVASKNGATVTYLHSDYLGSTAAETSSSGSISKSLHYQPFGESIETPKDDIGYTGHKFDTDLGLTYMQQRYYDPVIGRFYSNDPVGFTASNPMMFNRYAYGNNNPYKFTDPTGETAESVVLSRERGKVFVYPPSSHAHASKRHAQGYQGLGKGSPQQFMSKFGMQDYKMSATIVGAVVESGAEYYQEGTGTTVYTLETGQQIGELGETALSVATTPLSSLKDPAKIAEVTTMMTEAGVSQDQYGNVEVVTTIAPDNGTFKRDDAILMKKQE